MREAGFKATTASLDLLCEACSYANAEDAPDVYSALRAHDVPEFIAYTASMRVRLPSPHYQHVLHSLLLVYPAGDGRVGCRCLCSMAAFSGVGSLWFFLRVVAMVRVED